jgi:glutaredoxin
MVEMVTTSLNMTREEQDKIFEQLQEVTLHKLIASEFMRSMTASLTHEQRSSVSKKNSEIIRTCPHCKKSSRGGFFIGTHFDNCTMKGINLTDINKDIMDKFITTQDIMKKYDITANTISSYIRHHSLYTNDNIATCPHCKMSSSSNSFIGFHFDNCKMKGINLDNLNRDIVEHGTSYILHKYSISKDWYRNYKNKVFNNLT